VLLLALFVPIAFAGFAVDVRRRSRGALWGITATAVGVVVALALVLASGWGGNRLVASVGYRKTVIGVLTQFGFVFALPILVAAAVADALPNHPRVRALTLLATGVTVVIGIVAAMWILWVE